MAKENILIVDDEKDILRLLEFNLSKEGYVVLGVTTGEEALTKSASWRPQLIILDLMLPGIDGLEVCRALKNSAATNDIPVIILSAKGEESDIVAGLELGAEDYITKPFSPKILIARVRSVLRRRRDKNDGSENFIKLYDMCIDLSKRKVAVKDKSVELTPTEFDLLVFLARRPGWVFTRNQIIEAIKGSGHPVTDRSVDVQIVSLRKKLKELSRHIETVHGVGYRFSEQE